MKGNKKKLTAGVAMVTAMALLLGGTFAWQSISQTALNEKEAIINPGGRLHDDFDGSNKDIYVENFADDDIYARVRLEEYFEITMNKGVTGAEKTETIVGSKETTDAGTVYTYEVYKFDDHKNADGTFSAGVKGDNYYWNWSTGGSTVYMPTFNKNKDSLVADINGTMDYKDGETSKPYGDYVDYNKFTGKDAEETEVTGIGAGKTSDAIYDADSNMIDEFTAEGSTAVEGTNYKKVKETHYVAATGNGTLISMAEWLAKSDAGEDTANYWVYDTDGWCYWSSPIKKGTATGLLLDGIALNEVMDDSYYYAINVVGQFITADDLGKEDNTGFYADENQKPTDEALELLKNIGVVTDEGGTKTSIFENIEPGSTKTVKIDDVDFYVLAKDGDKTLIWSKDAVVESKFSETSNVWDENCAAYKTLVDWLESTTDLKDAAQNYEIKTRTEYASTSYNSMTCKVFLLSEADVYGTSYASGANKDFIEVEYTYNGQQLITNSDMLPSAANMGRASWLRSPANNTEFVRYINAIGGLSEYLFSGEAKLQPALWVKGL